MGLKPPPKQTDVGWLPPDWEVLPLGTMVQSIEYGSSAPSRSTGLIPVLRMGNLQDGNIDWNDLVYTSDREEIRRYELHDGDVLFNRTNTIDLVGKTSLFDDGPKAIFAGYLIRIVVAPDKLDARYLNYFMNTKAARRYGASVLSVAVGQANINGTKLRTYPISVPPTVREQRAIATALSDVDALLTRRSRLIAKKRDLKLAAMQQLLTGRTRLPGFHGEWQVRQLGDVVDTDPENLSSDTPPEFAFNYIALEDVDRGVLRSHSEQRFGTAPSRARRRVRLDDVLVSTVRPNLQSHLLFDTEGGDWVCSTGFCVVRCRPNESCPGYIFFQAFADGVTRQIDSLLTGSNYPAINSRDVRALRIPVPSYEEQVAIATVLSDMDRELAALEALREKTLALKQAMMQELLTGKTRLGTPSVPTA